MTPAPAPTSTVALLRNGRVVAVAEIAATSATRRRGLLGRDRVDGALVLVPARSVHTIGMRFAIDVAHLDADGRVLRASTMAPGRVGAFVRRSRAVVEAMAGSFDAWGVTVGDRIEWR